MNSLVYCLDFSYTFCYFCTYILLNVTLSYFFFSSSSLRYEFFCKSPAQKILDSKKGPDRKRDLIKKGTWSKKGPDWKKDLISRVFYSSGQVFYNFWQCNCFQLCFWNTFLTLASWIISITHFLDFSIPKCQMFKV